MDDTFHRLARSEHRPDLCHGGGRGGIPLDGEQRGGGAARVGSAHPRSAALTRQVGQKAEVGFATAAAA